VIWQISFWTIIQPSKITSFAIFFFIFTYKLDSSRWPTCNMANLGVIPCFDFSSSILALYSSWSRLEETWYFSCQVKGRQSYPDRALPSIIFVWIMVLLMPWLREEDIHYNDDDSPKSFGVFSFDSSSSEAKSEHAVWNVHVHMLTFTSVMRRVVDIQILLFLVLLSISISLIMPLEEKEIENSHDLQSMCSNLVAFLLLFGSC